MEQKNISVGKGIHRTPSIGDAGELSEAMNLIPYNGELVNIQQAVEYKSLESGQTMLAMHNYYGNDVLFYHYDGNIYAKAIDKNIDAYNITNDSSKSYTSSNRVFCIGNIVIIGKGNKLTYYRYKGGRNITSLQFTLLGNHLPEINLSFGLQLSNYCPYPLNMGAMDVYGGRDVINNLIYVNPNYTSEQSDYKKDVKNYAYISDPIMSLVTSMFEHAKEDGKFLSPFFVRYAYRLYDETLVMHSAPILMTPCDGAEMSVWISKMSLDFQETTSNQYNKFDFSVSSVAADLDYCAVGYNSSDLSNWKELIKSVDIFVSSPLYIIEQNGVPQYFASKNNAESRDTPYSYGLFGNDTEYKRTARNSHLSDITKLLVGLPRKTEEQINESINTCSQFYLLKSIPIDDIKAQRTKIEIAKDYLKSLTSKEAMTDDNRYHDITFADVMYEYNGRLNIAAFSRTLFGGFPTYTMIQYLGQKNSLYDSTNYVGVKNSVSVDEDGQSVSLRNGDSSCCNTTIEGVFYLYYPSQYAKSIKLCRTVKPLNMESETRVKTVQLSPHQLLNGSFYFGGLNENLSESSWAQGDFISQEEYDSSEKDIYYPNKITTSNVSNPFLFDATKVNTIGNGVINMLASAAKALSQGQFGEFPLYSFCSDGIWALSVSSEGVYTAKQPISRDVLSVKSSVTQLDNAVSFVTKEGVKVISGSDVVLISEPVHGINLKEDFIENTLGEDYAELYKVDEDNFITQIQAEGTKMCYDYAHQLIHLFLAGKDWHYVYSRKTNEWSKQLNASGNIVSIVPGYPLSTMQFGNKLYKYDIATDTKKKGFALTRSYACDNPFARKVIHDLRAIGQKHTDTSIKVAVFESNDNINWYRMKSLKGHSAKFYRFLIISNMYDTDTISGMTLLTEERYNHKLR